MKNPFVAIRFVQLTISILNRTGRRTKQSSQAKAAVEALDRLERLQDGGQDDDVQLRTAVSTPSDGPRRSPRRAPGRRARGSRRPRTARVDARRRRSGAGGRTARSPT